MPIYEYTCNECRKQFEELIFKEGQAVGCPACGSDRTQKLMSTCRTRFGGGNGAADVGSSRSSGSGGGCAGCSGGNCSSC